MNDKERWPPSKESSNGRASVEGVDVVGAAVEVKLAWISEATMLYDVFKTTVVEEGSKRSRVFDLSWTTL